MQYTLDLMPSIAAREKRSPKPILCDMVPAISRNLAPGYFHSMATKTQRLLDFDSPEPTPQEPTDAVQNDHAGITREPDGLPQPARFQQAIAFDDESTGHGTTEPAPTATQSARTATAAPTAGRVEERSFGNRLKSHRRNTATGTVTATDRYQIKRKTYADSFRPLFESPATLPASVKDETRHPPPTLIEQADVPSPEPTLVEPASGDKAKARDILTAIRTLKTLEAEDRLPSESERNALLHFHGFGPVALTLFPDPITGQYKHASWQQLGEELKALLTPDEYESARRTVFNAFYTSPDVIRAMHQAISRLGVGDRATLLEPGCGTGKFLSLAKPNQHFIGVELDDISGRIARKLHPNHDIRIENFRDTKLPPLDGVIGNVPFANIKLTHHGQRFALHDYFFAKSLDALKPGGVLALVTSHFTMDKTNAAIREYLGEQADFVGAIRLPSDAFKRGGTSVVTDIVFLKKRAPDQPAQHIDDDWLKTGSLNIDGADVTVNQYFLNHPEMVLGNWSLQNSLYHGAASSFSLASNGDLPNQLLEAVQHLPRHAATLTTQQPEKASETPFIRPPALRHISEGSFFVADDGSIMQVEDGRAIPAMHGQTELNAQGTLLGKRMAALLDLRDAARLVLQAQNEDWPLAERDTTRAELNRLYDQFVNAYGPINKTTFSETKTSTVIRRMPNLLKFREDPDAMLVMSLEDYDEVTAKAEKTAIFGRDVVGRKPTIESVNSAEEGLLVSLDQKGIVDLDFIASIYRHSPADIIEELGDLIFLDPASRQWQTADLYLSGNVREKLAVAQAAGPEFQRNAEHLIAVQPADVLPGEIDANLGSPWIPESDIQQFAAELFQVEANAVQIGHVKKDAIWSVDANYTATQSVAATSEFGTGRVNGTQLLEQALNMKSPTVYDTIQGPNGDERIVNQEETLAAREKQKLIKEKFKTWTFHDPERSERLVRIYNDTYNNLRPRIFDGSHLEFDGMNQTIQLRSHQKDAIWRGMSSGNTLLAHAVGAGKTFTMAATGMKMKQAGLIHKPMYVVPNHMLEQFSREFMQLYPNARLLVASKEDMTKERRKRLTAKIASGEWDGIVVTHSSFERIGMSKQYQQQFLQQQIDEYTDLIVDAATDGTSNRHRNLIKLDRKAKGQSRKQTQRLSFRREER
ncbi:MAG: DEAD/DEAH box helicase family protein [Pirellulaceae bacterium]